MTEQTQIKKIDDKIVELKDQKKQVELEEKNQKRQIRRERQANNNGKSNIHTRVSNDFLKKLNKLNDKREENGFDRISNPKITDLIIRHIEGWGKIERDIVNFNTSLEDEEVEIYA